MTTSIAEAVFQSELDLRQDLTEAIDLGQIVEHGGIRVRATHGRRNLWLRIELDGAEIAALRLGPNAGEITNVSHWCKAGDAAGIEFTTPLGPMRAQLEFGGRKTLRCKSSLLPATPTFIGPWPRDLFMLGHQGVVHTAQRGLRSGIVYGSCTSPVPHSVFYFQNFSALADYFRTTGSTPADSVGGAWPELGYAPPVGNDALPQAQEFALSDSLVKFSNEAPTSEEAIAALYLDLFAETYLLIEPPAAAYHPWDERASRALRDLTLSPACTYIRQGRRFLMPYVNDTSKPPESMVQFTVAVNTGEYDRWRGETSKIGDMLRATAPAFFSEEVGTVVRWLPGEPFDASQAEDNMSHEAMDSWYLHHSLFNTFRLAHEGDGQAKELFERSLPYVIRVARRFNYRWPIFFNLKTLDIIRAEAKPGQGGETDVAGIYALVMIHAYELLGQPEYLQEAEVAAAHLHGFGFNLAYQLNTTGFAAEAALRLWKITHKRRYLGLAETCLANIFDNMWLWRCDYGHARHYTTYFGLFPLRDAPYVAPYEELEAQAKFHEFLSLGGDDVRPSLRILIAEFQKYSLDRCWYYYPDSLPVDVVADKPRNGRIERALAVPLEDLQDGREQSGQVGQELYGAGLPFIFVARHYMKIGGAAFAYANYPMFDFNEDANGVVSWRAGGDPRCSAELRVFSSGITQPACRVSVWTRAGDVRVPIRGGSTPEGHAVFTIRGGQVIEIECNEPHGEGEGVLIGPLVAQLR